MAATASLLSPREALRCLARQLQSLQLDSSRRSIGITARNFSSTRTGLQAEDGQQQQSTSTSTPRPQPDFAAILDSSASTSEQPSLPDSPASPRVQFPPPSNTPSFTGRLPRSAGQSHARTNPPYRLHAHCTKHNTILAFTRGLVQSAQDFEENQDAVGMYNQLKTGAGVSNNGPESANILGQTVLRVSPGLLGLKKAQRGTFEAASRASVQMFNLIAQLGKKDRTNKHGQKVRDSPPGSIELILKGYGPGREALVAALNSSQGDEVRRKVSRITDATPIKIGGVRPKKRRKLSPPLDLGRRRR